MHRCDKHCVHILEWKVSCLNSQSKCWEEREQAEGWSDLLKVTPQVNSRCDNTVPICTAHPTVAFLDWRRRCRPLPLEHTTTLFDTVLYYLYIYLYTISSSLVADKKTTEGQQKEQLELCHNHPHARQMLMKTVMFWDLNTWLSTGLEFPFSHYHSPESLSCSGQNQNVTAVHSDCEVWTWNLIHRVDARFMVRWVLT